MRKNFSKKTVLLPLPVYIIGTYDENGKANAMNLAWGVQCGYHEVSLSIAREHKTTENILLKKAFTISLATKATKDIADYFGIVSGNKVDKIEKSGVHIVKSENIDAPIIKEFPLTLECKVIDIQEELGDYRVVAEIINTLADERVLNEKGEIDVDKLDYLTRDNHMTGEIAPKMDIKRLLACLTITENKELKYVAKAIPAVQTVVDSRDILYLWVYHHHISIYTDYIIGRILKRCMTLYDEHRGQALEEMNREEYFSPKAITDYLITDDDIYSYLRKIYVLSLERKTDDFNTITIKQIFERDFLKPLWKTIYEYKDFEKNLVDKKIIKSYDELEDILRNEKSIEDITNTLLKKLNLKEGEVFIITKYNKFYNSNKEAPISLLLNGEERKLSDLLPQKEFGKFHTMAFFVFAPKKYKEEAKEIVVEELQKISQA